ncbi:hypothetical protein BP6252_08122 [Coleophoma cylindrospora]|uniref:Alpha/beta hydrolase fold-3 domain-containing protein n=1 Tax=Coleophoma cylindrospora TaxID=1849047 RepID=A0A3D8RBX2_9HELO|nr:hypothetical protein BP6252_08122 [Coleophoma cylindrospora]
MEKTNANTQLPKPSALSVLKVILSIEFAFTKRLYTAPFRGENGAHSYSRDVFYAALRAGITGFTPEQIQHLAWDTESTYKIGAKIHGCQPDSVDLMEGAKGHWIGKKDAKYVMLFIHGGGFYGPASYGHLKYQFALQKEMAKQGLDFAIFSLSYTLAPNLVYPTQLQQAASALQYLLSGQGRDPSTILLAGDSAGGNLVTALLLHLARPHPSVYPVKLSQPLHGALLISPWVSFDTSEPSFKTNQHSDYITTTALERASMAYIALGTTHDTYTQPISAQSAWWSDVAETAVSNVMIWGGGGEILIDGITKFAAKMESGFNAVGNGAGFQFMVTPKQGHEEMIIDTVFLMGRKGDSALVVEKWLEDMLKKGNNTGYGNQDI